ncbi:BRAC1 domain containing protein [Entamoeba histolytica HM-1:IMSS-B]|uniref:BRCT domain-containing protein n=8 Tax=Entamoeba TaxID=5758 RepID=C4M4C9_ENTH1|nr:BRAC1 domain containing protein [Entamoeba nuttalli P19]XP_652917.1 hypothetical protein EHI_156290 [Entamoeba histolytica HM-1:IMSS]EMD44944.1 BRCA1 C terminus (BRCT) domain containing protein [Entamoeba histolytica KU27]EMH74155.1 BRAC1 domain containing protein [Entamoeba histolytica HM-1:IMSS-B]EMS12677.1 BRCA1 C Terminus (BRCT) domain containing protein [Entamoeba histolytica HM-3:IMSS]ENY66011.1 BRCA1 C Terminus (BRCT) domain containing protein [Entamoeba histolytica HM-1:IMSS-A]GAT9|eukprot:XP_008860160.1 BRAC1 domain containing protein [Entamoeba nuttalli P19]
MTTQPIQEISNQFLSGYVICVSGYSTDERVLLGGMIEQFGGIYMEDMESRSVSFLLSKGLTSDKARHAKRWGVPVLNHQWLFDCIVERRFVSINNYILSLSM